MSYCLFFQEKHITLQHKTINKRKKDTCETIINYKETSRSEFLNRDKFSTI